MADRHHNPFSNDDPVNDIFVHDAPSDLGPRSLSKILEQSLSFPKEPADRVAPPRGQQGGTGAARRGAAPPPDDDENDGNDGKHFMLGSRNNSVDMMPARGLSELFGDPEGAAGTVGGGARWGSAAAAAVAAAAAAQRGNGWAKQEMGMGSRGMSGVMQDIGDGFGEEFAHLIESGDYPGAAAAAAAAPRGGAPQRRNLPLNPLDTDFGFAGNTPETSPPKVSPTGPNKPPLRPAPPATGGGGGPKAEPHHVRFAAAPEIAAPAPPAPLPAFDPSTAGYGSSSALHYSAYAKQAGAGFRYGPAGQLDDGSGNSGGGGDGADAGDDSDDDDGSLGASGSAAPGGSTATGSKPRGKLSADERKRRRAESNRLSAERSREKRKHYVKYLEGTIGALYGQQRELQAALVEFQRYARQLEGVVKANGLGEMMENLTEPKIPQHAPPQL